ncbi:hypothetical protein [Clostridium ihumii]|uniref:hypothetical protein n=1 Tax=Clostridium ihumii TaxID=1470356 RepID=UPI0005916953|nr:hypothetical protein [Clostridium ihumii]
MDRKVNNILELIDYLEKTAKTSSNLLGKVSINKNELLKITAEIKENLPQEFEEAKMIVEKREEIFLAARKEAEEMKKEASIIIQKQFENADILKKAELRANEVLNEANMEARKIKAEANQFSKELKSGTVDYVDEILTRLQREIDLKSESMILKVNKEVDMTLRSIYEDFQGTTSTIIDNIKELGEFR